MRMEDTFINSTRRLAKPKKISITLKSDNILARKEMKKVGGNLTAVSLSADGHRVAVTARGEVFDVPADKGVTRDITRTPGATSAMQFGARTENTSPISATGPEKLKSGCNPPKAENYPTD